MTARKLWATQFPQVPGNAKKRHESQAAVYRYINAERANWACGALRSPIVQVDLAEEDPR